MAYDRYDMRRGRESSRHPDHDERSGRREERGFFERAGDEIASWFGDDDDDRQRRPHRDDDRERGEWRGSRGQDRDQGFMPEHGYSRSRYDSDYEDRGSSRPMGWASTGGGYRPSPDRGDRSYRPMTGDYGRNERARGSDRSQSSWGGDEQRRTSGGSGSSGREHDRHYHAMRDRQMSELDRDYDEYHRERQQHFENDFGSWRQTRQQKRQVLGQAREHMDVVGSDGEPVGKIDCVKGDRIILTKSDSEDGRHHSIPCTMIDKVEGDQLMLDCKAEDAKKKWHDESHQRALFEREGQSEGGPHVLDRSFSGTYR